MSTITDKQLVDELIANHGYYEDDPRAAFVVEYVNFEGGVAWGVTWSHETPDRQRRYLVESPYVRSPRVIWSAEGDTQ